LEYVYVTAVMGDGLFFGQLAKYDSGMMNPCRLCLEVMIVFVC